uniref:Uncharacterized protein n=1 Tax=Ditylenchus dipsaci TaxID=166011 RepID=A0A915CPV0_9BILA
MLNGELRTRTFNFLLSGHQSIHTHTHTDQPAIRLFNYYCTSIDIWPRMYKVRFSLISSQQQSSSSSSSSSSCSSTSNCCSSSNTTYTGLPSNLKRSTAVHNVRSRNWSNSNLLSTTQNCCAFGSSTCTSPISSCVSSPTKDKALEEITDESNKKSLPKAEDVAFLRESWKSFLSTDEGQPDPSIVLYKPVKHTQTPEEKLAWEERVTRQLLKELDIDPCIINMCLN